MPDKHWQQSIRGAGLYEFTYASQPPKKPRTLGIRGHFPTTNEPSPCLLSRSADGNMTSTENRQ